MANGKLRVLINYFPILAGAFSILLGLVVIIGWYSHQPVLIQILPEFVAMQFNTALGFVSAGLALVFVYLNKAHMISLTSAITILIGVLTGTQYLFGIELDIDQLFMDHYITTETSHPGRMAPNTALSFMLAGMGMLATTTIKDFQKQNWMMGLSGSIVLGLGLVAAFGYIFSLPTAYGWLALTRMAMHTAAGFSILGIGIILMAKKNISMDRSLAGSLSNLWAVSGVVFTFFFVFLLSNALHVSGSSLINLEAAPALRLASRVVLVFGIIMGGLLSMTLWLNRSLTLRAIEAEALAKRLSEGEAALTISEHRYRDLIENTKIIAWALDLSTFCFTYVSSHAEKLLGYKIQEWKEENFWADHIHPEDREGALALCDIATKAGQDHDFEYRMIKADGHNIWMRDIVTVYKDADGKPISLSGFLVNIDDEKRAQENLVFSENRYQRAIAGTNEGLWDWNVKTGEDYFSPRWAEILGYDTNDLEPVVETFTDIVHPDDRDEMWRHVQAHLDHKKPFDIEFRMRKKNGDYIWVDCKGSASWDEDGQPTFMAGAITDITERKLTQDNLLKSEQNLAITLNSIGDAVIATDAEGRVTRMNAVAEKLTGWSLPEAEGQPLKNIFSIINASTHEPIENPIEKVLITGETIYLSNHTTLIAKDGREYQIADSAAPIRNGDDKILGMVLVFNDVTESYRLREKAKAVHHQLQGLLGDMQTMVIITEPDGTINFVNKKPLIAAGLKMDDMLGIKIWEGKWIEHDPKIQTLVQNDCDQALTGQNILRDIQIVTPDGLLWISYSIHPVFNEDGQVIQLLHEGIDIGARKKIEDEIRESERHLRLYREQAPLAAIEWDTDFQIIGWNTAAEDMFGYSLAEVKGRDFVNIMLPESAKADVKQMWKDLIAQTGGTKSINENLTKEGRIILCEWHNTPLIDKSGTVIGASSLILDITAQHKAQQTLLAKEQEQREILDSMVDAVISIDETGSIVSFNKTAEALFGYSFDEIIGKNISLLMPKQDARKHDDYLLRYLKTGDARIIGSSREVTGLRKNKKTFPMRLSVAELPADEEGKKRFIGTCQDLTHIKQQEELLRRTQKMEALGKLTGGIAHDFNNMLGVIIGYADLLQNKMTGQPHLSGYINQIRSAGERGAKLTKKLLSFSQIQSPEATKLDINVLLKEQQDMLQKTLTVRINLIIEPGYDIWPIWLNSSDLENAIFNMSINAMYAMTDNKSGARLTIRTENQSLKRLDALALGLKTGDYILLSLTDTGCGMNEATKEQIFDPFFTTKGDKGTGLGLSQVFGLVKRVGGIIKVYSEPGHGSKFVLYFPRYHKDGIENITEVIGDDMDLTGHENILVVDDEAALRDLTSELLEGKGYRVFCAEGGHQALKILEKEAIDLMLSDVIMPEMDGYQLATIVQEKYPAIKIQLASGFTDDRHMNMTDQSLYQNLLHKPYNTQTLFENIRTLLTEKTKQASEKPPSKRSGIIPKVEWETAFSVGVAELDKDHKMLLSLLNRCIEITNGTMQMDELGVILDNLLAYAQSHFQREEVIMEACDYPLLHKHKRLHKRLLREAQRFLKDYDQGNLSIYPLLDFLRNWLMVHITVADKTAASHFKGKKKLIRQALEDQAGRK